MKLSCYTRFCFKPNRANPLTGLRHRDNPLSTGFHRTANPLTVFNHRDNPSTEPYRDYHLAILSHRSHVTILFDKVSPRRQSFDRVSPHSQSFNRASPQRQSFIRVSEIYRKKLQKGMRQYFLNTLYIRIYT